MIGAKLKINFPIFNTTEYSILNCPKVSFKGEMKENRKIFPNPYLAPLPKDEFVAKRTPEEIKEAKKKIKEHKDINPAVKRRISRLCSKSEIYNPADYVDSYINLSYYKNYDGEQTFCEPNIIEKVLEIPSGSVQTSYLQTMIELVQEGLMEHDALQIPNKNFRFNEALIGDFEKFYDVIVENRDKTKLKEELLEAYIPTVKTEKEGIEKSMIGDAFLVEGEKTIRMKTGNDTSKQMSVSKQTYNELFPMFKRFSGVQGWSFGDCFLIEPLMLLYQEPSERANIVALFKERKNGAITVELPNCLEKTTFRHGQLPEEEDNTEAYSIAAKGFRLLEYAYARNERARMIEKARSVRQDSQLQKFERFLLENGENIYIDDTKEHKYKKFTTYQKTAEDFDETYCQCLLANGGQPRDTFRNLGYDPIDYSAKYNNNKTIGFVLTPEEECKTRDELMEELLQLPMIDVSSFYDIICQKEGEDSVFDSFNVIVAYKEHAYGLKYVKYSDGTGEYYLYNPHHHGSAEKIDDLKEFLSKCSRVVFAEKTECT